MSCNACYSWHLSEKPKNAGISFIAHYRPKFIANVIYAARRGGGKGGVIGVRSGVFGQSS